MMYTLQNGFLPNIMSELCLVNNELHDHFTRQSHFLHPRKGNNHVYTRSFNHIGPRIWNSLQKKVNVVVYPLPWPLLVGGVRCSRLWSTSQLLRPSGQQCSHSGGVCPQIQGRQCGAYVGAVEEMMCVVCVDVTEGA